MVVVIFVGQTNISWWWISLGFVASFLWTAFDVWKISPGMFEYMAQINPFMQKLMEKK
jgi:hypothetical protein